MTDPNNIQVTLPLTEVNQVLHALSHQPYNQVASLIQKIKGQAEGQLMARQQTQQPTPQDPT